MYSKIFILAAAVLSFTLAESEFEYTDCGSTAGSIIDVVVKDCDIERCLLKRNHNASISITFKPNVTTENVTAVVHGVVLGFKTKFMLPNPTACEEVGLESPLQIDSTYTYTNTIFVKPFYPKVTVEIQWELRNDEGEDIICVSFPARIVDDKKIK